MSRFVKITDQEFSEIHKDFDSILAPTCPYKIQPQNQGKRSINLGLGLIKYYEIEIFYFNFNSANFKVN